MSEGLSLEDAVAALDRGDRSWVVPAEYLEADPDPEAIERFAFAALDTKIAVRRRDSDTQLDFEPPDRGLLHPMVARYRSACRQWQDEGLIPGVVSVSIDRRDLHVWSDEENRWWSGLHSLVEALLLAAELSEETGLDGAAAVLRALGRPATVLKFASVKSFRKTFPKGFTIVQLERPTAIHVGDSGVHIAPANTAMTWREFETAWGGRVIGLELPAEGGAPPVSG